MTSSRPSCVGKGLKLFGSLLILNAVLLGIVSIQLLVGGVYPQDGNGSLGHVGMVVAGIAGCLVTLTSGLLGIWAFQKAAGHIGGGATQ